MNSVEQTPRPAGEPPAPTPSGPPLPSGVVPFHRPASPQPSTPAPPPDDPSPPSAA